jgi:hypothetical protein
MIGYTYPKSLTFYQESQMNPNRILVHNTNVNVFATGLHARNAFNAINKTAKFNHDFNSSYTKFNNQRSKIDVKLHSRLKLDPSYKGFRREAPRLARMAEKDLIQLRGRGTRGWTPSQEASLLAGKNPDGVQAHHRKNVHNHPEQQANPDNIKFAKDGKEHLRYHKGNFKNPTDGDLTDYNKEFKNAKVEKEARIQASGLGAAVAIAAGIGFAIGFIITLAQNGVSIEAVKEAAIQGVKTAGLGAIGGAGSYTVAQTVGKSLSGSLQGFLAANSIKVTPNIAEMCDIAVVGIIVIIAFSIIQFIWLKHKGESTKSALKQVGTQILISLGILVISLIAQGLFAGAAGIIASLICAAILTIVQVINTIHAKKVADYIHKYIVVKSYPVFRTL